MRARLVAKLIALPAILIAVAIAGTVVYMQRQEKPASPRFTLATIDRGDIVQAVTTAGQLTPLVSVEVSTQISGLIVAVEVDFNQAVKKGQVLAKIDPSTYEQSLRRTQADLEALQAAHALNELKVSRLEGLLREKLVSRQEYDEAVALWRQSKASLLTREAAVENARVDLERCTIASPIDGIVIFKQVEVGKTIAAAFSAPTLFVIAPDLSRMRIIAPINEVDVWSVEVGQEARFTVDALPGRQFSGRLMQIRNPYTPSEKQQQLPAQSQGGIATFDGVIEVDNSALVLRPSLTATVSILVAGRKNVLRIPNGALRVKLPAVRAAQGRTSTGSERDDAALATVYRLSSDGRTERVQAVRVQLGISDSLVSEVRSGLSEGDQVITGVASEWEQRKGELFQ